MKGNWFETAPTELRERGQGRGRPSIRNRCRCVVTSIIPSTTVLLQCLSTVNSILTGRTCVKGYVEVCCEE